MALISLLDRLRGESATAEDEAEPTHVCQSCGETYYARPDVEIQTCRGCGGIRVEPV